jgi:hypothetical protein
MTLESTNPTTTLNRTSMPIDRLDDMILLTPAWKETKPSISGE